MRRNASGYLVILILLVAAAWASVQRAPWRRDVPTVQGSREQTGGRYVFHVDVAGWYATTPDETVVVSPYDLRGEALAEALPRDLAGWRGTDLGPDPEIEPLYAAPDAVVRRLYEDRMGHRLWLTAVASRGAKSFRLFEHAPAICYQSTGWSQSQEGIARVAVRRGQVAVHRGVFTREAERHVVYAWYQWDTPERDAGQGVAAWRLAADARDGVDDAEERLRSFVRLLFDESLPWHRF